MRLGFFVLLLGAFAAGHYSFFELRSATAKIQGALRPVLSSDVPNTDWAPAESEPSPLPAGTAVVRDDGGAIASVFVCYDNTFYTNVSRLFTDLFKKLPVDVQLQVGCSDEASMDFFEQEWGSYEKARGRDVVALNAKKPLTVWARDRQVALQGPAGKIRVSLAPRPPDDSKIYLYERALPKVRLAKGLVDRVGYMPFFVEGGNVASNGRHVFIGNNFIEHNQEELPSATALEEEMESLLGRDVFFVRDYAGKVPHEHLDMFMTPLDSKTILLADLKEGNKLLEAQEGRKPLASMSANPVKQRQLTEIGEILEMQGYTVRRIPAVFHSNNQWAVTYNNVLMERRNGEKVVYMPTYGFPVMDKAAASVYRELGFRVETIDVSQVFRGGGALRCVVNVTLRKPLTAAEYQMSRR